MDNVAKEDYMGTLFCTWQLVWWVQRNPYASSPHPLSLCQVSSQIPVTHAMWHKGVWYLHMPNKGWYNSLYGKKANKKPQLLSCGRRVLCWKFNMEEVAWQNTWTLLFPPLLLPHPSPQAASGSIDVITFSCILKLLDMISFIYYLSPLKEHILDE